MSDASAFSPDYASARARFRASAHALGCSLASLPLGQRGPDGEDLTIDVARIGAPQASQVVVVSSGLHGVEGFLGSAIQAALLEDRLGGFTPPPGLAIVLVHALNPYGFAWLRRVNEDNVDLNRNFLGPGEVYSGSPDKYAELDAMLNPPRPPGSALGFLPQAVFNIARHGMPALKNAVAGGQYDFPKGLFFGGNSPSTTTRLLAEHLPRWTEGADQVLHIDLHSGIGAHGSYKLLIDHVPDAPRVAELGAIFGADSLQPWAPGGVSYQIRGGLGTWCKSTFPGTVYDVLVAEFGTVHILKVIEALHQENRAHHHGDPSSTAYRRAKSKVKAAFCPEERAWRDAVVPQGLAIVQQAIDAAALALS